MYIHHHKISSVVAISVLLDIEFGIPWLSASRYEPTDFITSPMLTISVLDPSHLNSYVEVVVALPAQTPLDLRSLEL